MAHQAHNIPWTVLAENLQWRLVNRCTADATDFHLRFRPDQGKKLTHFVRAFARNVADHADTERRRYAEDETQRPPPTPVDGDGNDDDGDVVVVDEAAAQTIAPTLYRWSEEEKGRFSQTRRRQDDGDGAGSELFPPLSETEKKRRVRVLPEEQRRMSTFARGHARNGCYQFFDVNGEGFYGLEVFKMLLLYGEMGAVLRICDHPANRLASWWHQGPCYDVGQDVGWDVVARKALKVYILLNVLHYFPEHWGTEKEEEEEDRGSNDASRSGGMSSSSIRQRDYRNTRVYQSVVSSVTESGYISDVASYPHRQFFGIGKGQFRAGVVRGGDRPCGRVSYQGFLRCQGGNPEDGDGDGSGGGHVPTAGDVGAVRRALREAGRLPDEIAQQVLDEAGYVARARLSPAHHPFHGDNLGGGMVREYLAYCWRLLVRCEAAARAVGVDAGWEVMVAETLVEMFGCRCRAGGRWEKRWYGFGDEVEGGRGWVFR